MENSLLTRKDGLKLSLTVYTVKSPKGIVQMIHGAKEHKERYDAFAKFLQKNGFVVVISDNRGHGASVNESYPLGYMNSFEDIIEDQQEITKFMKEKFPNIPYILFGHSLGSMFARVYLEKYDEEIDALILSGTANFIPLGIVGIGIGKMIRVWKGSRGYSKFLERFANFLDDRWVVKNELALENYRNDPLCTYKYPIDSMITIFEVNRELHRYSKFACKKNSLPILMVSGEDDPVTGGAKGLQDTIKTLNRIGYQQIKSIVYPNMAHEVLNEKECQKVYEDILGFIEEML